MSIAESLIMQEKRSIRKGRPSISVDLNYNAKKKRGPAALIPNKLI